MSHPVDPTVQSELESLSEAIAEGLDAEHLLALIAQRACQVLLVAQAHIFLRQGPTLVRSASHQALEETPLLSSLALGEGIEGWVARRARPVALEQAQTDRRYRSLVASAARTTNAQDQRSVKVAAVPIWSGRRVVGVLSVVDFDAPPSSASAPISGLLPLLSVLADLISLALENTRLLAREERRAKLISLLHYLASDLSDKLLKEVAQAMEEHLGEVMEAQRVDILLYNQETAELVSLGSGESPLGRAQQELGLDHVPLAKAGVLAEVLRTGNPFLSNDLGREPAFPTVFTEKLRVKSALVVPLEVEGQRRGLLTLLSSNTDVFFEEDLSFLLLISSRLGHMLHEHQFSQELAQAEVERLARTERENFLFLVAHDLKNALTSMRGNAQLALRRASRGDSSGQEQAFRLIAARSGQALQLVSDLVDVNQIDIGLFTLSLEPVDLVELLEEELQVVQESAAQHPITFQHALDQAIVEADRNRLSQVLTNLLTNAIRYSPQGGAIEVILSATPSEPGPSAPAKWATGPEPATQAVLVCVNDKGIGIAPGERERIFERAFRGRGAQYASGSGLGLYISREIIERHGGHLWAEPRAPQGASFCFTLPLSRSNLNERAKQR
jgi:signal transduction histidine kinase